MDGLDESAADKPYLTQMCAGDIAMQASTHQRVDEDGGVNDRHGWRFSSCCEGCGSTPRS